MLSNLVCEIKDPVLSLTDADGTDAVPVLLAMLP